MHFSMEQRVERFQSYYRRENARPLLGFFVESEYPIQRYRVAEKLPQRRPLTADNFQPRDYLADGANGGYIFAPSQILGPDIPVENIAAMYDAVQQR